MVGQVKVQTVKQLEVGGKGPTFAAAFEYFFSKHLFRGTFTVPRWFAWFASDSSRFQKEFTLLYAIVFMVQISTIIVRPVLRDGIHGKQN